MGNKTAVTVGIVLAWAMLNAGCASRGPNPADFVKPSIAVMKFENRAPFPLRWDLGSGMRDVLVDRLMATQRFHVIERPEIDSILREVHFQQSGMTRPQEKVALGQLKNVQYLIKGTVTDFSHTGGARGFVKTSSWGLGGGTSSAVMGIILYVVDVESGEILCSESLQESVHASDVNVAAAYKDVAFGGSVFFRTPLGEATEKVIGRAVERVMKAVASRPWMAKIAQVQSDGTVILNGGQDRSVRQGSEYEVMELGAAVVDPDTGDVIGRQTDRPIGRIRVTEVQARYSVGLILGGQPSLKVGQPCRRIDPAR